jgi:hypothetical protein
MPTSISAYISSALIFIDKKSNYVPISSTLTNSVNLIEKIFVLPLFPKETIKNNRYFSHINNKRFSKCFLLLIPGLGNFIYVSYKMLRSNPKVAQSNDSTLPIPADLKKEKEEQAYVQKILKRIKNTYFNIDVINALKLDGINHEQVALAALAKVSSSYVNYVIALFSDEIKKNETVTLAIINSYSYIIGTEQILLKILTVTGIHHEKVAIAVLEKFFPFNVDHFLTLLSSDLKQNENVCLVIVKNSASNNLIDTLKLTGIKYASVALATIGKLGKSSIDEIVRLLSPDLKKNISVGLEIVQIKPTELYNLPELQHNEPVVLKALIHTVTSFEFDRVFDCIPQVLRLKQNVKKAIEQARQKTKPKKPRYEEDDTAFFRDFFGYYRTYNPGGFNHFSGFNQGNPFRGIPGSFFLHSPQPAARVPWVCPEDLKKDNSDKGLLIQRILYTKELKNRYLGCVKASGLNSKKTGQYGHMNLFFLIQPRELYRILNTDF